MSTNPAASPATAPEQPTPDLTQDDQTTRAATNSDNSTGTNADDDGPATSLDNDDYLDFLIAGYDPDETPPEPHDRFPRSSQQPTEQPPSPIETTAPSDEPPPF